MQSAHAAAKGGSFRSKFEQQATVISCRVIQFGELERLEVMGLEDELPQWPLLQLVLVPEPLDG